MTLTNRDIVELTAWRRKLHQHPEISNEEEKTAREVVDFLADTGPDKVLTGLGGHGVAAVYESGKAGPTVLFRSELDALPIDELSGVPHSSLVPGKSHMCGHDGHTAILAALGRQFGRGRPARGRVVLMFQPAEETGNGAAGVVADPRFAEIAPDFAFSLHNMPGVPFGEVRLKPGVVNCASRGMRIVLEGKTAHSSMPETGVSPMMAVSRLMPALPALGRRNLRRRRFRHGHRHPCPDGRSRVRHRAGPCRGLGDAAHQARRAHGGPVRRRGSTGREDRGRASSFGSLRLSRDLRCQRQRAGRGGASARALDEEGIPHREEDLPMRASEDFGVFGHGAASAMFFLGAGERYPALHNPDYDFPDDLIPIGSRIFMRTARNLLG